MLYADQQCRIKQKYDDLRTNWLDVFLIWLGMTWFLMRIQSKNIELDSKLLSLEHQCLCFYVDLLIL